MSETEIVTTYTAGDAAAKTGIPYDRLDYWCRTGFVVPSIQIATGKGSERRFSRADLRALRVARELRDVGLPIELLRRVVVYIQQMGDLPADRHIVLIGDSIRPARDEDDVLFYLRGAGATPIVVVDIGEGQ